MGRAREHPRLRGEDSGVDAGHGRASGTPPPARGRHISETAGRELSGNTPACAGKTGRSGAPGRARREHPRLRGEDSRACTSQPRRRRNTPACAGKTSRSFMSTAWRSEHPRLRGEDRKGRGYAMHQHGTPPPARGRRSRRRGRTSSSTEHPRLRGEDIFQVRDDRAEHGTPPPARGRHFLTSQFTGLLLAFAWV